MISTFGTKTKSMGFSSATQRISTSSFTQAAQPSHDWAAKEPMTDFSINAMRPDFTGSGPGIRLPRCFYLYKHQQSVWGSAEHAAFCRAALTLGAG